MGNCCGSPAGGAGGDKDNVQRKKSERLANWKATRVIALRSASLTALPSEIAEVPSPRVLDASDNKLAVLPAMPSSLVRLVLANNRLGSLEGMQQLHSLKVLILDGNRITQLPKWIGELTKLETLSLSDNLLTSLPPSLGRLGRLKQLLVSQNRLTTLPPDLWECEFLEEIDAHHNAIESIPPELGRLQRLRLLQLDSNALTSLPPAVLRDCSALTTLSLHGNPISPDALAAIEGHAAFEARRQGKYSKTIASGVLLGSNGMDEGVDRLLAPSPRRG